MKDIRRRPRVCAGPRRGQSMVELALTIPLMVLLVMGVIDFGWVLYAHIQVAAASTEGARAGAVYPADWQADTCGDNDTARASAVRKAIYDSVAGTSALGALDPSNASNFTATTDVAVTFPVSCNNIVRQGQEMVVRVTYHQPVWFSVLPGISPTGRIAISTTTKVRIQ